MSVEKMVKSGRTRRIGINSKSNYSTNFFYKSKISLRQHYFPEDFRGREGEICEIGLGEKKVFLRILDPDYRGKGVLQLRGELLKEIGQNRFQVMRRGNYSYERIKYVSFIRGVDIVEKDGRVRYIE